MACLLRGNLLRETSFWITEFVCDTYIPLAAADHSYVLMYVYRERKKSAFLSLACESVWELLCARNEKGCRVNLQLTNTSPKPIVTVTIQMKKPVSPVASWGRRKEGRRSNRHRSACCSWSPVERSLPPLRPKSRRRLSRQQKNRSGFPIFTYGFVNLLSNLSFFFLLHPSLYLTEGAYKWVNLICAC